MNVDKDWKEESWYEKMRSYKREMVQRQLTNCLYRMISGNGWQRKCLPFAKPNSKLISTFADLDNISLLEPHHGVVIRNIILFISQIREKQ